MGRKIKIERNKIVVPSDPIIPYIEGDGIGVDIWPAAQNVFDSAVSKAYGDERIIEWKELIRSSYNKNKIYFVAIRYQEIYLSIRTNTLLHCVSVLVQT